MDYERAIKLVQKHVPESDLKELCDWLESNFSKSSSPACPNCSVPGKAFFMSLLPKEFIGLEGVTHECNKCGYK